MAERTYSEDEVRKIFALATSRELRNPAASSAAEGLTLAEIQSIGQEVGLEPYVVARGRRAGNDGRPPRKSWGMPIEVGCIVPLPRALTEREWERLVAELRVTFRAKGKLQTHGSVREWWNGNLHACMEPADTGYRLRLGTIKGDAAGIIALGVTGADALSDRPQSRRFLSRTSTTPHARIHETPEYSAPGCCGCGHSCVRCRPEQARCCSVGNW